VVKTTIPNLAPNQSIRKPTCAYCQDQHPVKYRGCQINKQLQLQRNRQSFLKHPSVFVNTSESQADSLTTIQIPHYPNNQPKYLYVQATSGTNQNPLPFIEK